MAFSERTVAAVWEKARAVEDRDPVNWRKDQCGAWLQREQYNQASPFGWKILNVSPGGPDLLDNLQPFHQENSYDVASNRAQCRVQADREDQKPGQRVTEIRNTSTNSQGA